MMWMYKDEGQEQEAVNFCHVLKIRKDDSRGFFAIKLVLVEGGECITWHYRNSEERNRRYAVIMDLLTRFDGLLDAEVRGEYHIGDNHVPV